MNPSSQDNSAPLPPPPPSSSAAADAAAAAAVAAVAYAPASLSLQAPHMKTSVIHPPTAAAPPIASFNTIAPSASVHFPAISVDPPQSSAQSSLVSSSPLSSSSAPIHSLPPPQFPSRLPHYEPPLRHDSPQHLPHETLQQQLQPPPSHPSQSHFGLPPRTPTQPPFPPASFSIPSSRHIAPPHSGLHAAANAATSADAMKPPHESLHTLVSSAVPLPHIPKMQSASHLPPHGLSNPRFNPASTGFSRHALPGSRSDSLPSVPLPMHPDPVQQFAPQHEPVDHDRSFAFPRQPFLDDIQPHDDTHTPALPPPPPPPPPHDSVDVPPPHNGQPPPMEGLPTHLNVAPAPSMSTLPLPPTMPASHASSLHVAPSYPISANFGPPGLVGGPSDMADALGDDRKAGMFQHRIRPLPRPRNQQLTESQRRQRHNEHTRASRSRIDRGLERLKAVIKKVRPHQKVSKKADVLHEAVKLLKEGYRLPKTESDEERDDPQESSLSV